jgi:hypothetical protein
VVPSAGEPVLPAGAPSGLEFAEVLNKLNVIAVMMHTKESVAIFFIYLFFL